MIVSRDGPLNWIAERDNGEKIKLSYTEIRDIYWHMRREILWEEVAIRIEDIDSNDGADGEDISEVEKQKDEILNYVMEQEYRTDDIISDIVWDAIKKFCPNMY